MEKDKYIEKLLQDIDGILMQEAKVKSKLRAKIRELWKILTPNKNNE